MRLSNTLVVFCAAVLLASGHALSETTNADQAIASKFSPLELGASIDALASENKRSLRSYDDDDEEETYASLKIDNLRKGKWNGIFAKWKLRERSSSQIEKKLAKLKQVNAPLLSGIIKTRTPTSDTARSNPAQVPEELEAQLAS